MLRAGYDPRLATGVIGASATLAQLIPPSTVLIFIADILQGVNQTAQLRLGNLAPEPVSVGDLFAGAFLPGFLLVGLFLLWSLDALGATREARRRWPAMPSARRCAGTSWRWWPPSPHRQRARALSWPASPPPRIRLARRPWRRAVHGAARPAVRRRWCARLPAHGTHHLDDLRDPARRFGVLAGFPRPRRRGAGRGGRCAPCRVVPSVPWRCSWP